MSDFILELPSSYATFNDFFIREVKKEARPIPEIPCIGSAGDCRLMVFDSIEEAHNLFIKGKRFSLENMVKNDEELVEMFKNASVANFRLAPQDYHRFHSCISGTVKKIVKIDGTTFTTEPKALKSDINVLGENERVLILIENELQKCLYIPIGAEAVGKVNLSIEEGNFVNQGDCIGYFDYGGSDILVFFEPRILWDQDIQIQSKKGIECLIKANEKIGE